MGRHHPAALAALWLLLPAGETVPGTTLTGQPGGYIVRKLAQVK